MGNHSRRDTLGGVSENRRKEDAKGISNKRVDLDRLKSQNALKPRKRRRRGAYSVGRIQTAVSLKYDRRKLGPIIYRNGTFKHPPGGEKII